MRKILAVLSVFVFAFGVGALAGGGTGPGPVTPENCPDHDDDGICNGQDPDYVPGGECPNCPNPDCPGHESLGVSDLPGAVKSMIRIFLQLGVLAS